MQDKLPTGKVRFIDANNRADINQVLIIPTYAIHSGAYIGFGIGEGLYLGKTEYKCDLLAHPFIHKSDSTKFVLEQPLSNVIGIPPWVAVGTKAIEIRGAIAIAKGYKPEDVELRYFMERPLIYKLTPINERQTKKVLSRISEGIHNRQCEVFWCNENISAKDCIIKCDFTKKDWKMIEKFIKDTGANLP
jgi:hypothetical protein